MGRLTREREQGVNGLANSLQRCVLTALAEPPRLHARSITQSCLTLQRAHHAPLSMEFSRWVNTGVGCHFLLQGIFLTQGSNPRLLRLLHRQTNYH